MSLAEDQELMKERWQGRKKLVIKEKRHPKAKTKHGRTAKDEYLTSEALEKREIAEIAARTDLICSFCNENPTKASKITGEVQPCKRCKNRKAYLVKYGLSLRDYTNMLNYQQGRCAICDETMVKVNVDHCHELTHVRGLLCSSCNFLLGAAQDNEQILKNALKYLQHNKFQINWSAPTDYAVKTANITL